MTLGPTRQTLAQRLLADYRRTGVLPTIHGGDHDGGGDNGNDSDQSDDANDQNDDADSGGNQEDRSDNGDKGNRFKAITSQDDLDRIIRERLGRERKRITKDVRQEIEDEAARKAAEEQGDYKKLYDDLKATHDEDAGKLTTATAELDQLRTYVKSDIEATAKAVREAAKTAPAAKTLLDFHPGDEAAMADLLRWTEKAKARLPELTEDTETKPGHRGDPKRTPELPKNTDADKTARARMRPRL